MVSRMAKAAAVTPTRIKKGDAARAIRMISAARAKSELPKIA